MSKIKYGKVELTDADFKNPKVRITMMVDEEVLEAFRTRARESGEGYQTLMNRALREAALKPDIETRLRTIEQIIIDRAELVTPKKKRA